MKKLGIVVTVVALLGVLAGVDALAQRGMHWRGSGGWGPGGAYGKMYDPKTVETVKGEVVKVDLVAPMKGMSAGVHLALKTDTETISVHLGPSWYLENQDVKLQPKDTIEITGSRVTLVGKPAIIAAQVKKGDETLKLRDDAGFPVWSGWRRGPA